MNVEKVAQSALNVAKNSVSKAVSSQGKLPELIEGGAKKITGALDGLASQGASLVKKSSGLHERQFLIKSTIDTSKLDRKAFAQRFPDLKAQIEQVVEEAKKGNGTLFKYGKYDDTAKFHSEIMGLAEKLSQEGNSASEISSAIINSFKL